MRLDILHEVDRTAYLRSIRQSGVGIGKNWVCWTISSIYYAPKCIMATNPDQSQGGESELQNAPFGICLKVLQLIAQYEEGKVQEKLDCLVYHVGLLFRMMLLYSTNKLLEATSKGLDTGCGFALLLTSGHRGRPKLGMHSSASLCRDEGKTRWRLQYNVIAFTR